MAGGDRKIHEHPKAGTNNFKHRPQDAGRKPVLPDLQEALAKLLAEESDGRQALELALKAIRAKAFKGDVQAFRELLDRAYGKPKQTIQHEGMNFENVQIIIKRPEEKE